MFSPIKPLLISSCPIAYRFERFLPPKWNVIIVVQLLSCVQNFEIPWTSAPLSFTTSQSLLRFNIHRVSDAMQPSHLLLSPSPPAFQSFPASGSFAKSWLFASGGQSIGASALESVLPVNIQGCFLFRLTGLISLMILNCGAREDF